MTKQLRKTLAVGIGLFALASSLPATAGMPVYSGKDKIIAPEEEGPPLGSLTLGAKFSENLSSVFVDGITPFWAPGDFVFFLSTKTSIDDNSERLGSYGLGARYLVPGRDIIVGANVFYDGFESQYGNHFDQLGIGAEVLTRWVDARMNFYIPEDDIFETQSYSKTDTSGGRTVVFRNGNNIVQRNTTSKTKRTFKQYEGAISGFNAEIGFLVPGLDEYMELRLFAGYYNMDGALSNHHEGFKARLEARVLPGVILDGEYWDDAYLMGGHWTAGIRVVVPFSIGNIFVGRNPFEGAAAAFTPRKRDFKERLSESIIRSHQVMTDQSPAVLTDKTTSTDSKDTIIGQVPKPPVKRGVPGSPGNPETSETPDGPTCNTEAPSEGCICQ